MCKGALAYQGLPVSCLSHLAGVINEKEKLFRRRLSQGKSMS